MIPSPYFKDLAPYPSERDEWIGFEPLAVGWLRRGKPFPTGKTPPQLLQRLVPFCHPDAIVAPWPKPLPSGLDNRPLDPITIHGVTLELGRGEIRVMGDETIYAAPDLIIHYIQNHQYLPPEPFIDAVMNGPSPSSPEFRALIRSLQQ